MEDAGTFHLILSQKMAYSQGCHGYGYPTIYPWIYPYVDIRHRLPYGYIHGYFYVFKFELSHH